MLIKNLLNLFLFIFSIILLACANEETSSKSETNDKIEKKAAKNSEPVNEIVPAELDENEDLPGRLMKFKNADWYVSSGKKEIFNGINLTLMQGVILKYIREKHIDPKRDYGNFADYIELDLKEATFIFFRKMESKHSLYDAERYTIINGNRWYSDEEPTQQEIKEVENEQKRKISEINPDLKNIKAFDVYAVRGKYYIQQVKMDSIKISIKGDIAEADAMVLHAYQSTTGFGLMGDSNFEDQVNIDLSQAFTEIGSIQKFFDFDLQIINNQALKYIRNHFFARKGYIFKTDGMKDYFNKKPWYTPEHDDVSSLLTPEEKFNAELIKQAEEELK
ncbi:MAG: YARHG domain-containing protein [Bacteroidales bacterium]|nr:YARHG domain-containing protein [Bacteroidales bacterium]